MTLRLIINADDYGLTPEVSRGIREAHLNGIVTSTTCMLNMPSAVSDIGRALSETPRLGLGVHLVLTAGQPLSTPETVPSLCDDAGRFHKLNVLRDRLDRIDPADAEREWRAQVAAFVAAAGRKPTHLDSHHHSSYFTPELFQVMLTLARETGCAIRLPGEAGPEHRRLLEAFAPPRPDTFSTVFYDEGATVGTLLAWMAALPDGVHELMTHPGYCNARLEAISSYARQRDRERRILAAPEVLEAVAARGVDLIAFDRLDA